MSIYTCPSECFDFSINFTKYLGVCWVRLARLLVSTRTQTKPPTTPQYMFHALVLAIVLVAIVWRSTVVATVEASKNLDANFNATTSTRFSQQTTTWGKNILFLIGDDAKPAISSFGDPLAITPNLDRLARNGIRFSNAHAQVASCGPSRASLLSSLRPDTTKLYDMNTQFRKFQINALTLPQIFKSIGYRVFGSGKIQDGRVVKDEDFFTQPPSYDIPPVFNTNSTMCFDAARPKACDYPPWFSTTSCGCMQSPGITKLDKNGYEPVIQRLPLPDEDYLDARMVRYVLDRLKSLLTDDDTRPFVLIAGFASPHLPFAAPNRVFTKYDSLPLVKPASGKNAIRGPTNKYTFARRDEVSSFALDFNLNTPQQQNDLIKAYHARMTFLDEQIGKILDLMDATPTSKRDDTIIVFLGDHGFHLGDHGYWGKHTVMEQATRAALIIAPGAAAASIASLGNVQTRVVEFVDVLPTLLDMTGLLEIGRNTMLNNKYPLLNRALKEMQGKSLMNLMQNTAWPSAEVGDLAYFAISQYKRDWAMGYAIRTNRYRFTQWFPLAVSSKNIAKIKPLAEELYDMRDDPNELSNIVLTQPKVKIQLKRLFINFVLTERVDYLTSRALLEDCNDPARAVLL